MPYLKLLLLILLLNFCCCNYSDSTEELGLGYWLRIEGKGVNEILNHDSNKKGIPPDVIRYNYNDELIIAEQMPNKYDDIMYDDTINYKFGRDVLYYWIIIKKSNFLIGPMNIIEFDKARIKYQIPEKLELISVY